MYCALCWWGVKQIATCYQHLSCASWLLVRRWRSILLNKAKLVVFCVFFSQTLHATKWFHSPSLYLLRKDSICMGLQSMTLYSLIKREPNWFHPHLLIWFFCLSFVKNKVCSFMEGDQKVSNYSFPPGFRFHPSDEELIVHYLQNKISSRPLPASIMAEIDLYKYNPWELPSLCFVLCHPLFIWVNDQLDPERRKYIWKS